MLVLLDGIEVDFRIDGGAVGGNNRVAGVRVNIHVVSPVGVWKINVVGHVGFVLCDVSSRLQSRR